MQQAIPAIAIAAVAIFAGAIAMYILHAKRKKSKFKGDAKNGAGKGTSPERMVINRYIEKLADLAVVESKPVLEGKNVTAILAKKKK